MFQIRALLALLTLFVCATVGQRVKPQYRSVQPNTPVEAPVAHGLFRRQVQCPTEKGTCNNGCCLYSQGCCFDGCSSYAPGIGSCCVNGGSCGQGEICCGAAGCIPEGARCCSDGGSCDAQHECVNEPGVGVSCCPNGQCSGVETNTGAPEGSAGANASSPRTSHPDGIIAGPSTTTTSTTSTGCVTVTIGSSTYGPCPPDAATCESGMPIPIVTSSGCPPDPLGEDSPTADATTTPTAISTGSDSVPSTPSKSSSVGPAPTASSEGTGLRTVSGAAILLVFVWTILMML